MGISDALAQFFAQSRLPVLFAGAGVSARAGLPTWGQYLGSLASAASEYDQYTKFMIDKAVSDGALTDAAALYMMCREMPESKRWEEMSKPLLKFESDKLNSLVALPFQAVVTTNFDRVLFSAYAKCAGISAREVNIDDPALDAAPYADDFYIARIHGRVEIPSSMRLTREDFSLLQKNEPYVRFLEHLLTRRQVLFLGFSFLDPAIMAVLKSVRAKTGSLHGQEHWALVPKDGGADFMAELEAHSIRRIEYDSAGHHKILWDGVEEFNNKRSSAPKQEVDVRDIPFAIAKKYLATAFARSRLGRQREPLAQAMAEGVVSGVITKSSLGITEPELTEILSLELAVSKDIARTLVARSVVTLSRDGICDVRTDGEVRYFPKDDGQSTYDGAVERLVDGIINRYKLQEGGIDSREVRIYLSNVLAELLLQRGWELGAAYAGRRMPEDVDLASVMDRVSAVDIRASQFVKLERSLKDLLVRPDDEEAALLADLGRTAFGLELLLEAPHDSLFATRVLPERIYFDANVLMPAITIGHPLQQLFDETIQALRNAAGGAASGPSLRVYDGFLNEIVSHKRLAIDAMEESGGEGAFWEERSVGLFGTANVNVYVGAFFNYRILNPEISFREFLSRFAPYENETGLKKFLGKLGFEVIHDSQANKLDSAGIIHCLDKFYATKFEHQKKSPIVVRHDAMQLAILNADLADKRRSVLVSADRGIRFALESGGYGVVANSVLTHLGLTQLVELMVGKIPAPRGMASLLWMSPVSSDSERVRSYLISLALREHDVATAMYMPDVIDEIVEDTGFELERKNLKLATQSQQERLEVSQVLERYEKDFFKKMNDEVERARRNGEGKRAQ